MYFNKTQVSLASENQTRAFAKQLSEWLVAERVCEQGWVIYLEGDLGVGKSFLTRALIQNYLPNQKVKSPTYTLVETYDYAGCQLHHFDLYRLCDPEELEFLGVRDLLQPPFIAFVEWPSKGDGVLPEADMVITLKKDEVRGEDARCLILRQKND